MLYFCSQNNTLSAFYRRCQAASQQPFISLSAEMSTGGFFFSFSPLVKTDITAYDWILASRRAKPSGDFLESWGHRGDSAEGHRALTGVSLQRNTIIGWS